tara:strand:- start:13192 stop:13632 length:441 start_codon:yes stop_codon:yes gene_type:complete
MTNNVKQRKSYLLKAYEKYAMLTFANLSRWMKELGKTFKNEKLENHPITQFEGLMSVMMGTDQDGIDKMYLVIESENSTMPIAEILSESAAKNVQPNFERGDKLAEKFIDLLAKEKRFTLDAFDQVSQKDNTLDEVLNDIAYGSSK